MPNIFITPQPKITMLQVELYQYSLGKQVLDQFLSDFYDGTLHITLLGFWTLSISHTKKKNLLY
jgi:hypothetical protein